MPERHRKKSDAFPVFWLGKECGYNQKIFSYFLDSEQLQPLLLSLSEDLEAADLDSELLPEDFFSFSFLIVELLVKLIHMRNNYVR